MIAGRHRKKTVSPFSPFLLFFLSTSSAWITAVRDSKADKADARRQGGRRGEEKKREKAPVSCNCFFARLIPCPSEILVVPRVHEPGIPKGKKKKKKRKKGKRTFLPCCAPLQLAFGVTVSRTKKTGRKGGKVILLPVLEFYLLEWRSTDH